MQGKKPMNRNHKKALLFLAGTFCTGVVLGAVTASLLVKASEPEEAHIPAAAPTRHDVVVTIVKPSEPTTPTTPETETETAAPVVYTPDPAEVELIGRTIWGEAGGVQQKAERAAVAWCILNRVDAWGKSVEEIVTAPYQFLGYRSPDNWGECPQEHLDLAADVLTRWHAEKEGAEDVGRVLPADYLYFLGDGRHNHFTTAWRTDEPAWDWSAEDPYKNK